jgi:hypothetical protein
VSFERFTAEVLTDERDIDASLAAGGLARPPGVPLELWLAQLTDEAPEPIAIPPPSLFRTSGRRATRSTPGEHHATEADQSL